MQYLFSFRGRITRRAFWLHYALPVFGIWLLIEILLPIDAGFFNAEKARHAIDEDAANPFSLLTPLGMFYLIGLNIIFGWVGAIAGVKRLHDLNRSGWLIFITLVLPIGLFWFLIYLGLFPGTKGPNHFGPDPREQRNPAQPQATGAM